MRPTRPPSGPSPPRRSHLLREVPFIEALEELAAALGDDPKSHLLREVPFIEAVVGSRTEEPNPVAPPSGGALH